MLAEAIAATETAEAFLRTLAAGDPVPAERIAVVIAHPDDETIGLGGQLGRLPGVTLIHVTDGAPRRDGAAERHGFASPAAYAAARRDELRAAMALADVPEEALLCLGIADQEASLHLAELARQLAALCRTKRLGLVITHAYEGGHPDHDATAFAVHAAAALLARAGAAAPALVEMPLYHLGPSGWAMQRFVPAAPAVTTIRLDDGQRRQKQEMLDAHATQRQVLSVVTTETEQFRPAPAYDFSRLPNDGCLLYERYEWGLTGERWLALTAAARDELGAVP